ncbi:RNA polymerase sigma factor [Taibaiella koreensis]|uniref:RNA polymerase sigma factor n=1 Tax=Taibaiella koreensis TaxID=1268548 RepID=UPI000E5991ED|nr:sigma-70 family RNA polymerase sigma factor [Taibaiella koreensis]
MKSGNNNNEQLEHLLETHKGILFKVARAYCAREEDRQDLIQEMMIQVWHALPRYDVQYKMSTWLYRIALNVAISYYRKQSRKTIHIPLDDQAEQVTDYESGSREQQLRLLEQFIAELNELDKALILLYLEDKSHAEIGDIMGLSISNVGTRVGRIKDRLKKRFSQKNNDL